MGNPILIMFVAVEAKTLALPVTAWNDDIGNILQKAFEDLPASELCMAIGRGWQFYDILDTRNRCNLKGLNFLDCECSILQGLELVEAIHSLTIVIDELLNNFEQFNSVSAENKNKTSMMKAFADATINFDIK